MKDKKHTECTVCSPPAFERNNFYYSKLMSVSDFKAEQDYFNGKRWLINRTVHGSGVVCGLKVKRKPKSTGTFVVSPGLALDCCGRELLICEASEITLDEGGLRASGAMPYLYICVEYHECRSQQARTPVIGRSCDSGDEFNRIRDSFRLSFKSPEEVAVAHGYDGQHLPLDDFVRQYLAECSTETCSCVALARLRQLPGIPEDPPQYEIDEEFERRYVYGNELLYRIIERYFDKGKKAYGRYPRITNVSWRRCHSRSGQAISWRRFQKIVERGLAVYFDRHMEGQSLNWHTFLFSVTIRERATGYLVQKYIPPEEIRCDKGRNKSRAIFFPDSGWIEDEVLGRNSEIAGGIARVEIVLRSSLIFSKDGRALDGDFLQNRFPTGNGVPGGDFVSCFSVRPRERQL